MLCIKKADPLTSVSVFIPDPTNIYTVRYIIASVSVKWQFPDSLPLIVLFFHPSLMVNLYLH